MSNELESDGEPLFASRIAIRFQVLRDRSSGSFATWRSAARAKTRSDRIFEYLIILNSYEKYRPFSSAAENRPRAPKGGLLEPHPRSRDVKKEAIPTRRTVPSAVPTCAAVEARARRP